MIFFLTNNMIFLFLSSKWFLFYFQSWCFISRGCKLSKIRSVESFDKSFEKSFEQSIGKLNFWPIRLFGPFLLDFLLHPRNQSQSESDLERENEVEGKDECGQETEARRKTGLALIEVWKLVFPISLLFRNTQCWHRGSEATIDLFIQLPWVQIFLLGLSRPFLSLFLSFL